MEILDIYINRKLEKISSDNIKKQEEIRKNDIFAKLASEYNSQVKALFNSSVIVLFRFDEFYQCRQNIAPRRYSIYLRIGSRTGGQIFSGTESILKNLSSVTSSGWGVSSPE